MMKGSDHHPKDHNIQIFTDASNIGWGAQLEQDSGKGLCSDGEKKTAHKSSKTEDSLPGPEEVQGPVSKTVLIATDSSTVVAYINKQGGTHSREMCALLWRIMTWCHYYYY